MSGRALAQARRKAMSTRGKLAVRATDRVREMSEAIARPAESVVEKTADTAALQAGCGCGCKESRPAEEPRPVSGSSSRLNSQSTVRGVRRPPIAVSAGRAAALARRKAQSSRGKAGMGVFGLSAAQTARAANPGLSGRELAQALRDQRSRKGRSGQKKPEPTGRQRPARIVPVGAAQDAPRKVGASETGRGQIVTGTMVGRAQGVTGDEPSTCRHVTGTEYMGADIFRDLCQAEPLRGVPKVRVSPTSGGNRVTGNEVGRSRKVTGDEPGTCQRVTGVQYVGAGQMESFCGTSLPRAASRDIAAQTRKERPVTVKNPGRSVVMTGNESGAQRILTGTQCMQLGEGSAPAKVGRSETLRGGSVTGTMVGRGLRMTGDEPGSCRIVTGDDYVGQEQFKDFCTVVPPVPGDHKVGQSSTVTGKTVTGTMTGRAGRVTGDEPGTCKAITGTPYAGAEQYRAYCEPDAAAVVEARMERRKRMTGAVLTGRQPAVGGAMTGDAKGACAPVSGTPYVGADQLAEVCPASAAEVGSPDYPQSLGAVPWGQFSVATPVHASQIPTRVCAVTGAASSESGQVTGPFGMAAGKVTGTDDARFGHTVPAPVVPEQVARVDGRVKSRITGEGQDAGQKITGDDWDRGDRVTGTEGSSATRRNPTRRGEQVNVTQPPVVRSEVPKPVSKVTGGSGNTEKGALVTYSGGARG